MRKLGPLFLCLSFLALAACSNTSVPNSPPEAIKSAAVAQIGPPSITLYTMISNSTGEGAHSSILINADQRVIFDPAGAVRGQNVIARDDVIFNVTPGFENSYARAHARSTYHVVIQKVPVSQQSAVKAKNLALVSGPVPSAFCANATSKLLAQLPEFSGMKTTMFPKSLKKSLAQITGVEGVALYENDDADKTQAIAEITY